MELVDARPALKDSSEPSKASEAGTRAARARHTMQA